MNRQKLGLPGQYGPAVFERQQSPWERIQPVLQAVSFATGTYSNLQSPTPQTVG